MKSPGIETSAPGGVLPAALTLAVGLRVFVGGRIRFNLDARFGDFYFYQTKGSTQGKLLNNGVYKEISDAMFSM